MHLEEIFLSQVVKMLKTNISDTSRRLFAGSVFTPRFCPSDRHRLVFVGFVQLCLNSTQATVDGISTLISEGDTDFFYCLEKLQKEHVLTGKKSDRTALYEQEVKAAPSSHTASNVDLLDLLVLD